VPTSPSARESPAPARRTRLLGRGVVVDLRIARARAAHSDIKGAIEAESWMLDRRLELLVTVPAGVGFCL